MRPVQGKLLFMIQLKRNALFVQPTLHGINNYKNVFQSVKLNSITIRPLNNAKKSLNVKMELNGITLLSSVSLFAPMEQFLTIHQENAKLQLILLVMI